MGWWAVWIRPCTGALLTLLVASAAHAEGKASGESLPGSRTLFSELHASAGLMVGFLAPATSHNFESEMRLHQEFMPAALSLGVRAGIYPIPVLGAELEGTLSPTYTRDAHWALLGSVRALAVARWELPRITPFVALGGGTMGALHSVTGKDMDPLLCLGVGAKFPLGRFFLARFDLRENFTQKNQASLGSLAHHPELLLSAEFRFPGRVER